MPPDVLDLLDPEAIDRALAVPPPPGGYQQPARQLPPAPVPLPPTARPAPSPVTRPDVDLLDAGAIDSATDADALATVPVPKATGAFDLGRTVADAAQATGLPPELLHGVIRAESGGHPGARSPKGALGIMQLMPDTALRLGVNPLDPAAAIAAGARHLADLRHQFGGDTEKALAAWNWRPANVRQAVGRLGEHWRQALPRETQGFIANVLGRPAPVAVAHAPRGSQIPPAPTAETRPPTEGALIDPSIFEPLRAAATRAGRAYLQAAGAAVTAEAKTAWEGLGRGAGDFVGGLAEFLMIRPELGAEDFLAKQGRAAMQAGRGLLELGFVGPQAVAAGLRAGLQQAAPALMGATLFTSGEAEFLRVMVQGMTQEQARQAGPMTVGEALETAEALGMAGAVAKVIETPGRRAEARIEVRVPSGAMRPGAVLREGLREEAVERSAARAGAIIRTLPDAAEIDGAAVDRYIAEEMERVRTEAPLRREERAGPLALPEERGTVPTTRMVMPEERPRPAPTEPVTKPVTETREIPPPVQAPVPTFEERRIPAPEEPQVPPVRGAEAPSLRERPSTEAVGATPPPEPLLEAPRPAEGLPPAPPSVAFGKQQEIRVPAGRRYTVRYEVVEAGDLIPSHDPVTFAPDPRYPERVQPRPYHSDPSEQAKVIRQSQDFEPLFLVSPQPSSGGSPILAPRSNVVLSGNSRAMSLLRTRGTPDFGRYRQAVEEFAPVLGIDPEAVRRAREPVLVRRLVDLEGDQEGMRRFAQETNEGFKQALSPEAQAVSRGQNLSPGTVEWIAGRLDQADQTLREFLRSGQDRELVRRLLADAVTTEREVNRIYDAREGRLTEDGRRLVERAILGRVIRDPDLLQRAPDAVLDKIGRSLGELAQIQARGAPWDLSADLEEAVRVASEVRARQMARVADLRAQTALIAERPVNPRADALAEALLGLRPTEFRGALRRYAEAAGRDVRGQEGFAFVPRVGPEEAFADSFGMPRAASSAGVSTAPPAYRSAIVPPDAQAPSRQISERSVVPSETMRMTMPSTREGGQTTAGARVGTVDASGQIVHQPPGLSASELVRQAREIQPEAEAILDDAIRDIPGARLRAIRVKEDGARLAQKLQSREPHQISDYLGARVSVDNWDRDVEPLRQALDERTEVTHDQEILEETRPDGYVGRHLQVRLPNGMTMEVQLHPREVSDTLEPAHRLYERRRTETIPTEERTQLDAESRQLYGEALRRYRERVGQVARGLVETGIEALRSERGLIGRPRAPPERVPRWEEQTIGRRRVFSQSAARQLAEQLQGQGLETQVRQAPGNPALRQVFARERPAGAGPVVTRMVFPEDVPPGARPSGSDPIPPGADPLGPPLAQADGRQTGASLFDPNVPSDRPRLETFIERARAFAREQRERLPMELAIVSRIPESPVMTAVGRFNSGHADRLLELTRQDWAAELMRRDPQEIIRAEHEAVTRWRREESTDEAERAAVDAMPSDVARAVRYRDEQFERTQQARTTLGLPPLPKRRGPYLARMTSEEYRDVLRVGQTWQGLRAEVQTTIRSFGEERVLDTMQDGLDAGVLYEDPRMAWAMREWFDIKVQQTAQLMDDLTGTVLFRTRREALAASPAGTVPVRMEGLPGSGDWWARSREEGVYLQQNLLRPERQPWFNMVHTLNQLFRNPNLFNPLPHTVKNMGGKLVLAMVARGANPARVVGDMLDYRRGRADPVEAAQFRRFLPISESGKLAGQIIRETLRPTRPPLERAAERAIEIPGMLNRPAARTVFQHWDPAMRFADYMIYRREGKSPQVAANHALVDLVNYSTRSELVDRWKSFPGNFFVPWRTGTVTTLTKALRTTPLRVALFVATVDLLRDWYYRRTGRHIHLFWDYVEGPIATALDDPKAVPFIIASTLAFGPGGTYGAALMLDILKTMQGTEDYSRVLNMFWGLAQGWDAVKEMNAFRRDRDTHHLVNVFTTAVLGAHSALKAPPRTVLEVLSRDYLPDWLDETEKADIVRRAEAQYKLKRARAEQRQERAGARQPPILERIFETDEEAEARRLGGTMPGPRRRGRGR